MIHSARGLAWLTDLRESSKSASRFLLVAMAVSAAVSLYFSRGMTFSGDEVVWVAQTPGLDLHTLLQPHGGHLIALSRLVYWPLLNLFGLSYLPYRLLALGTVLLTVWLLYLYGRRRVEPWLALAPCLILLFFGSDPIHFFQGNGFTVMMSVAFGIAGLLCLERGEQRSDLLACLWLTMGVISYTVILPFVIAAAVMILVRPERWRRIWVPLVPLAVYGIWRIWLIKANVPGGGGADLASLLTVPAWSFQSLSGILNALTGLSFDFSKSDAGTVTGASSAAAGIAGPPLALLFICALYLRIDRRGLNAGLLVAVTAVLALFVLQAAGSGSASQLRIPGGYSRYLFPGAVVVVMVAYELARSWRPGRVAWVALGLVVLAGIGANLQLMRTNSAVLKEGGDSLRAFAGALQIGDQFRIREGDAPPPVDQREFASSSVAALTGMNEQSYGHFAFAPRRLGEQPPDSRQTIDLLLVNAEGLSLKTLGSRPNGRCRTVAETPSDASSFETTPGRVALRSVQGGSVSVGRFADTATVPVGSLMPRKWSELNLPADEAAKPWKIAFAGSGLRVCHE